MITFTCIVSDDEGLHARPATMIAAEATTWRSSIYISCGGRTAAASDPFALLGLRAQRGDELTIQVSGEDEEAAADALKAVFAR